MAIRGRFGRLPRAAPSLTSTIVALAQQYQSQRDTNIETAWKSGGLFEGKKVTDEMFMAHWKQRRDSVDSQDPMWDYYNNLIYSYTFTIAESKMGQKYAEGKVNEAQMASFYRSWAAKLPHDSEAYRQLMTQAAKFKATTTAKGHGSSAKAAEAAYQNAQANTYKKNEAPFDVATGLIARYAVQQGILDPGDLNDPDYGWSKLTSKEGDPERFSALLADLQDDPTVSKYITDAITTVTGTKFSGKFNEATLSTLADNARNGAQTRANRASKAGKKADTNAANKAVAKDSMTSTIIRVSLGTPGHEAFVVQNQHFREQMDAVLSDPNATFSEKQTAAHTYRDWLAGQGSQLLVDSLPAGAMDPQSANFDPTAAGIWGRVGNTLLNLGYDRDTGKLVPPKNAGQNLKDDLFANTTPTAGVESDSGKLTTAVAENQNILDQIGSGKAVMVQTDGNGKPSPTGSAWEAFPTDAPEVAGNDNLVPIVTPAMGTYTTSDGHVIGGNQGEIRYVSAADVKVEVYDYQDQGTGAYTGKIEPFEGTDTTVGKQVNIVGPGGHIIPVYGTFVNGQTIWSTVDPFNVDDPTMQSITQPDGTVVRRYTIGKVPDTTGAELPPGVTAPKPDRYNPQSYVNPALLVSPATKPDFDPTKDKQTGFDSPFSAAANSSSEGMDWVLGMGEAAVKNAETQWFSNPNHWTPQMQAQFSNSLQNGASSQDAVASIVDSAASKTWADLNYKKQNGFTPEQQSQTRANAADARRATAASMEGLTPGEAAYQDRLAEAQGYRSDLIEQVDLWGIFNPHRRTPDTFTTLGGVPVAVPGQDLGSTLPTGWTPAQLLTQPGMSNAAANDLAYKITGGAVGNPIPTDLGGKQGPVVPGYANPFMPKPGTPFGVQPKSSTGMRGPATPVYLQPAPPPGTFSVLPPGPKVPAPTTLPSEDEIMKIKPFVPPVFDPTKVSGNPEFRMPIPKGGRQVPF